MHLVKGAARFASVCALAIACTTPLALAQHAAKDNADGQTVAKDNNGHLRKPTAEEAAELTKGAKNRTPLSELKMTVTPSGAVGFDTDETYETSVIATRGADGKLKITCDDKHDQTTATSVTKTKKNSKATAKQPEVTRAEAQ